MDAGEIFDNLTESRYWDRSDATWADDLATVIDCLRENASEEGGASVYTEEEYAEHKSEQERQRLERTASQFARAHSVTPGTIEFFEALDRAQDREKSYREGLREDGLCATAYPFSSAGVEQWNEMNSDSYGRTADIRDVREWVQSNCPLLWLKYQEGKLQEANA